MKTMRKNWLVAWYRLCSFLFEIPPSYPSLISKKPAQASVSTYSHFPEKARKVLWLTSGKRGLLVGDEESSSTLCGGEYVYAQPEEEDEEKRK